MQIKIRTINNQKHTMCSIAIINQEMRQIIKILIKINLLILDKIQELIAIY